MVGTFITPVQTPSPPTVSMFLRASNMLPMSSALFTTPLTSPRRMMYPHLTLRPKLPESSSASGFANLSTSIPESVPAMMSSRDPLPGATVRFSGFTTGALW